MNITVFTSCQPRHISLIEHLAGLADTVYASIEVNTLFPGQVNDSFRKSDAMETYFTRVIEAERNEFGPPRFLPKNALVLPMKSGDLSKLDPSILRDALDSDVILVFGASYIRKPLVELVMRKSALNIHMGVSPYYRGSSCNFWALYDNKPDYVGATIHQLTSGLDSGPMLCHALPQLKDGEILDGFGLGMRAVRSAFDTILSMIESGKWREMPPIPQDKSYELRYTQHADFTDDVAADYLARMLSPEAIKESIKGRDISQFVLP